MQFDYLSSLPQQDQIPTLITDLIENHSDRDVRIKLAKRLGYSRVHIINTFMNGSKKLRLDQLIPLSKFFDMNVDHLLPYWISQESSEADHPILFDAMRRIVPTFEWLLLDMAKEVYLGDAAEDL